MRGERRYQGLKMLARVLRVWRLHDAGDVGTYQPTELPWYHLVGSRQPCSCPWCGNPRRWFGQRTPQECRADEEFRCQVDDVLSERPVTHIRHWSALA